MLYGAGIRVHPSGKRSKPPRSSQSERSCIEKSAEIRDAAGDQHPERRLAPLQDPRFHSSAKIYQQSQVVM